MQWLVSADSSLDAGTRPSKFCISFVELEVSNFMFPQDDPVLAISFHGDSNCRRGLRSCSALLLLAKTFTRQIKHSNSWRRTKRFWGWQELQVAKWKSPQQPELAPPILHLPTSLPTHTAKSFRGGTSTPNFWHKPTTLPRWSLLNFYKDLKKDDLELVGFRKFITCIFIF